MERPMPSGPMNAERTMPSDGDARGTGAKLYASPIDLPEGTSGALRLGHKILTGVYPIVGMRQAFLRGVRPVSAKLCGRRVHVLSEDGAGVWMTDMPEELEQIAAVIRELPPVGRVLIGGLGLGVLPAVILAAPFVDSITVVEKSPDVIRLCRPRGPAAEGVSVNVVCSDIAEFLASCPAFDSYYLDTWQGTNEGEWWQTVMPLRRIIANRWGRRKVWCWAEDIMLGQCRRAAFLQGGKHWWYKALPEYPDQRTVNYFFRGVGMPAWEKRYGARVDELVAENAARARERNSAFEREERR